MKTLFTESETIIHEDELTVQVNDIIRRREEVIKDLTQLSLGKDLKILDFTEPDENGFTEYIEGLSIKNVTTPLLHVIGVTLLYVEVFKEIEFDSHAHEKQAQVVHVIEGKILSENKIEFLNGESYFVSRKNRHAIKYYPGTKALIVYLPNLNTIKT